MNYGMFRVASASLKLKVANPSYNKVEIKKAIYDAEKQGVRLLVTPELSITGYSCGDLFFTKSLLKASNEALYDIVEYTKDRNIVVVVGAPWAIKNSLYNCAFVIYKGEILMAVPKKHLPNYNEFYEKRWFAEAMDDDFSEWINDKEYGFDISTTKLIKLEDEVTVGVELCEDLWVTNPPSNKLATEGANIIINLSASDEYVSKAQYRKKLIETQSAKCICGYIYASAGEGESTQDLVFGGQNMIAENGSMLAESRRFENSIIYSEIDVQRLADERRRMSTYPAVSTCSHTRVDFSVAEEETRLTRKYPQYPFVPSVKEERDERCEEILNIQAMGLKKRMEHIHSRSAVVGLSGGLDSTLALLVMARAFDRMGMPREQIHCVTMPCFGTTDRTYQNACKLSRCLGARLTEVNIKEAVNIHFRDIGHDPEIHDVTYENSQARERTQILMDTANKEGGVLVGTGDLSELALGWATYNGDHMSMYGVNASVPKTLVRHLVRYYADTCGDEELKEVLLDILDTPVSPELLPPKDGKIAQKTEDLVGPYELHDFYLYYMLRAGFTPDKIYRLACLTFDGIYDKETILKWLKTFYRRFFAQQFKRSCLPDGPKVGSVALSPRGDLRMPSDASARIWQDVLEKIEI